MADIGHTIVPRHLAPIIEERMQWSPVVVVGGARTCGKSTLLSQCAESKGVPIVDLDDDTVRGVVAQDVSGYLARLPRPVCIDEFQRALEILDGIKSDLNRGARSGQYLLTGSTRYTTLPSASQSLTGRAHLMTLWPLSQGELNGHRESFVDTVLNDPASMVTSVPAATDRRRYEEKILLGGYPMVHALESSNARKRWFRDLVALIVKRDVLQIRAIRRRALLDDVLRQLASMTAQVLNTSRIANQLGVAASHAHDLTDILEAVYVVHRLPAFGRTLGSQVGRSPKIHMADSGLGASLMGVTERKLHAMNPSALVEFGHLVETFVVNELIKQAGWSEEIVDFFHFRTRDNKEVDLVMQTDDGRVAAMEIKSGSKVTAADFNGMRLLRNLVGDDFVGGVLLNLGSRSYQFEPGLYVMPIETLWTHGSTSP